MTRWRGLAACTIAAALVAGCAPAEKQAAVKRIANAIATLGVRTGTITVSTRPIDVPTLAPAARPKGITLPTAVAPTASLRVVVDRAGRRAALLAPPEAAARIGISGGGSFPALVLFDGDRVYVRATDAGLVGARPWLAMDLRDLGAVTVAQTDELSRPRTAGDLVVVSPMQVLDLALGVLTGSVTRLSATQYRAKTSIEKEYRERDFEASDTKDFEQALRSFAAKDDINPIDFSLAPDQSLQKVAVDLIGRPEYGIKFATQFVLELDPKGDVDTSVFAVPRRADVVEVNSIGDIRAAIDEWTTVTEVTP